MALTGFDPDLVSTSIDKVISAYEELMKALGDDMQTQFVNGMQDKWACNDAQTFFQNFKEADEELITKSNNTFESVVNSMNSAAQAWAESTGSNWGGKSFTRNDKKIDITGIQENIGGVRGVDPEATTVSAKLPTIATSAESALTNAQSAVSNCGFVGGNQEAELINSLGEIKNAISKTSSEISEACKKAIDETAQKYQDLGVKVSDAFAGK